MLNPLTYVQVNVPIPGTNKGPADYWNQLTQSQYFYPALGCLAFAAVLIWLKNKLPDFLKGIIVGLIVAGIFGGAILAIIGSATNAISK